MRMPSSSASPSKAISGAGVSTGTSFWLETVAKRIGGSAAKTASPMRPSSPSGRPPASRVQLSPPSRVRWMPEPGPAPSKCQGRRSRS